MSKPKRKRKSSESVAEILARWRTPLPTNPAPEEPRDSEVSKKKRRGGGA